MKFQIKNRFDLSVIFECEADSIKLAVKLALEKKINLHSADLRSADLRSANLHSADLRSADLRSANLHSADLGSADLGSADLRSADLRSADLRSADLRSADLRSADLHSADLRSADLRSADLRSANLHSADLGSADLRSANLRSANLHSAKGINKYLSTPLLMLLDQPGPIRAYKLVNGDGVGPFNGGIKYEIGKSYEVKNASTDDGRDCAEGINLATLDWCMREWKEGYRILVAEFSAQHIAAIPIGTQGKFRVHRCSIVGEKNLEEIGLVKPESVEKVEK